MFLQPGYGYSEREPSDHHTHDHDSISKCASDAGAEWRPAGSVECNLAAAVRHARWHRSDRGAQAQKTPELLPAVLGGGRLRITVGLRKHNENRERHSARQLHHHGHGHCWLDAADRLRDADRELMAHA